LTADAGVDAGATIMSLDESGFVASDANCNLSTTAIIGGSSVTLTSVTGGAFVGSFDMTLASGDRLTGSFDAAACAGLSSFDSTPLSGCF
jgi:hypothetical protein